MPIRQYADTCRVVVTWPDRAAGLAAVLAVLAAPFNWYHTGHPRFPEAGTVLLFFKPSAPDALLWSEGRPPALLLAPMVGLSLIVLMAILARRGPRWLVPSCLIAALALAVLLAMGNPMPWPWDLGAYAPLTPSAGYWLAVAAFAGVVTSLLLRGAGLLTARFRGTELSTP